MAGARSSVPIARMSGAVASTLVQMLRRRAQEQPTSEPSPSSRTARARSFTWTTPRWTFAHESWRRIWQQAVGPGERALLVLPPGLDYVAALFGCFYAGVVAVPVYAPRRLERVATRLQALNRSAQATVLLAPGALLSEAAQAFAGSPELSSLRHLAVEEGCWGRRGLVRARPGRREHRVPPVHLRLHRRPQGRDGHPRQPAAQLGADPASIRAERPRTWSRELAAALPRHGPDRRHPQPLYVGASLRADVAGRLPAAAAALAGGDLALPGDDQRRPQLRLRPVRARRSAAEQRASST